MQIIDIRAKSGTDTKEQLDYVLQAAREGYFPLELHYDQRGIELCQKGMVNAPHYYLSRASNDIFCNFAKDIILSLSESTVLIDLGAGDMKKARKLAEAAHKLGRRLTIYGLDLDEAALVNALQNTQRGLSNLVECIGVLGTYDDFQLWLEQGNLANIPKVFLWLGSTIGNMSRTVAAKFLREFNSKCCNSSDRFLIEIDRIHPTSLINQAYDVSEPNLQEFHANFLDRVDSLVEQYYGTSAKLRNKFKIIGEMDEPSRVHRRFYISLYPVSISPDGPHLSKGQRIRIAESWKYNDQDIDNLLQVAGFEVKTKWTDEEDLLDLWLFSPL